MSNTQTQDLVALIRGEFAKGHVSSIADVLDAINSAPELATGEAYKDVIPKKIKATDAQLDALVALPALLEDLKVPTSRREITAPEAETINALRDAAGHLDKLAKAIYEVARTIKLNDQDVRAERTGRVDSETPRDKEGHYIIDDDGHFAVVGQDVRLEAQPKEPGVALSYELLRGLVIDRKLASRKLDAVVDYQPVVNEAKVLEEVRKDPKLAPVLAQAAVRVGGSVSVVVKRNN